MLIVKLKPVILVKLIVFLCSKVLYETRTGTKHPICYAVLDLKAKGKAEENINLEKKMEN